jgi:hypothetical protein
MTNFEISPKPNEEDKTKKPATSGKTSSFLNTVGVATVAAGVVLGVHESLTPGPGGQADPGTLEEVTGETNFATANEKYSGFLSKVNEILGDYHKRIDNPQSEGEKINSETKNIQARARAIEIASRKFPIVFTDQVSDSIISTQQEVEFKVVNSVPVEIKVDGQVVPLSRDDYNQGELTRIRESL